MQTLVRDGVRLAYLDEGAGEPPLLLVHGWCCDHTHMEHQVKYFESNHRVVAVDLRGHGASDAPEQVYTIDRFADDLVWMIGQLALVQPVVIGHSMGGTIAMQLAADHPELVSAIVAIDSSALPTEAAREYVLSDLVPGLRGADYQSVARSFVEQTMFLPTDDPALKARVIEEMAEAPQHVMVSAAEDMFVRDGPKMASACRVPFLYITGTTPRSDLDQLRELCPQVVIGQTVGAGHFSQLLVPDQINAMIARFLSLP